MRVARRTFLASTMATVAAPVVLRVAFADAPQFVLKMHHAFSAVSSAHDKFLAPWARQVEAQSGGRIRIDIFPSMQLGGAPADLFDQARYGVADFTWASPRRTPGRFPRTEAFELPFVPSRRALVSSKALDDYVRANAADEFRDVHPICFSCSDRGVLHANRPVRTIDDIEGLRLHVETRYAAAALRALKAVPVPMPSAQLPLALQQRVVDGGLDPWDLVPALKLNDLLRNHTEFADVSLSSTTYLLAMNKATYDKLPRDLKAVIDVNSGAAAAGMAGAMWDVQAAAVAESVAERADPVITLQPEAVARWRKTTDSAVESWLKDMKERKVDGAKLIAGIRTLLAKYAGEPEPQPAQTARPAEPAQQGEAPRSAEPKVEAKPEAAAPPKVETPPQSPAPPAAKLAPAAKPAATVAAPSAPTPQPAPTPAPAVLPAPTAVPAPVPATASAAPAPPPAPAPPAVVVPSPPPPSPPPAAAAAPPAAATLPVRLPPPKTLDIPL